MATALFHRVGRRLVLTAAGEALEEPARQVLRDLETGRAAVEAVAGLHAGRLDLVALPTLAVDPVAPLVARSGSHTAVSTSRWPTRPTRPRSSTLVASGESELGITAEPVLVTGLTSHPLGQQDLLAVLPPGRERVAHHVRRHLRPLPTGDRAGRHHHPHPARGGVRRGPRHPPHRGGRRPTRGDPPPGPRGCGRHPVPSPARRAGSRVGGRWSSGSAPACPVRCTSSTAPGRSPPPPRRSSSSPCR